MMMIYFWGMESGAKSEQVIKMVEKVSSASAITEMSGQSVVKSVPEPGERRDSVSQSRVL